MGIWAAAFALIGVAGLIPLYALGELRSFELSGYLRTLVGSVVRWGIGGAGMGFTFAAALLLGERRHALNELSGKRFAAWGFVAGAIVPAGMAAILVLTGHSSSAINLRARLIFPLACGVFGAALAAMTLRAARRAPVSLDETVLAPVLSVAAKK